MAVKSFKFPTPMASSFSPQQKIRANVSPPMETMVWKLSQFLKQSMEQRPVTQADTGVDIRRRAACPSLGAGPRPTVSDAVPASTSDDKECARAPAAVTDTSVNVWRLGVRSVPQPSVIQVSTSNDRDRECARKLQTAGRGDRHRRPTICNHGARELRDITDTGVDVWRQGVGRRAANRH